MAKYIFLKRRLVVSHTRRDLRSWCPGLNSRCVSTFRSRWPFNKKSHLFQNVNQTQRERGEKCSRKFIWPRTKIPYIYRTCTRRVYWFEVVPRLWNKSVRAVVRLVDHQYDLYNQVHVKYTLWICMWSDFFCSSITKPEWFYIVIYPYTSGLFHWHWSSEVALTNMDSNAKTSQRRVTCDVLCLLKIMQYAN